MIRELVELASRVAELERRFSGAMRHGTVEEVDAGQQLVRLKLGKDVDGKPFLSPWVPYTQTAGALKVHTPPSKGQQFTMLAPTGDWQQAVALPMTWSDSNKSPSSSGDENVMTYENVTATLKNDLVEVNVGGSVIKITSDEISLTTNGSRIVLNAGGVTVNGSRIDLN